MNHQIFFYQIILMETSQDDHPYLQLKIECFFCFILPQINAAFLTEALKPHAQPWLSLGDKLGKVGACLAQGKISKVTVTTHGAEMKSAGRYISAAVSAGIIGGNDINLVNSAIVAKEKGFEVFPEFNLKFSF